MTDEKKFMQLTIKMSETLRQATQEDPWLALSIATSLSGIMVKVVKASSPAFKSKNFQEMLRKQMAEFYDATFESDDLQTPVFMVGVEPLDTPEEEKPNNVSPLKVVKDLQ